MKYYFIFLCSLLLTNVFCQSNTEVFLFDLESTSSKIEVKNGKNISNNEGYDNQPSFLNEDYVLFASSRNDQTDIAKYHINYKSRIFINSTQGGEYSPLKIPNKYAVSAVRLDKDGKQRLYSYNLSNGESTELIQDLVVAYYTWHNENTIVSAVIEEEQLNLYVTNLLDDASKKHATKVGRSFHKIPNSDLVSFISKENDNQWQIKSFDPSTGKIRLIANTIKNVEDICWLDNKTILCGNDSKLYKLTLKRDNSWKTVADLSSYGITKITRLAVNAEANKLLIAGDISTSAPNDTQDSDDNASNNSETETTDTEVSLTETQAGAIVQKHIDPFNTRRLDEFANAFDDDVVVNRFPKDYMYSGRNTLKENYKQFFKNNKKSNVKVLNRMVHKNTVIDEELVTVNNRTVRQATVYEVDDKGIKSMTFVRNKETTSNPEAIVNTQLERYNERDIEGFTKTYSNDIKLYTFPENPTTTGQAALKKSYATFFERVPDLNAEVMNRIVLGNKVIDKEKVIINGQIFYAIAIYEVNDGLISRVTFIQ
ncbi:nuclear transport factor 2 family protein [Winogradskyella flava]|uniref:Nuclear transport factor 2 family protein n=1 Tax=Winogradskyella flava TaxID=1884876 RepID=A0A842IX13_9FLAO|nr:nuclear transport factor 2 family protein [Winogradskyella flava]MBC2845837.1 nuclear transport factor 2 family protein [Winogradskyella flava]